MSRTSIRINHLTVNINTQPVSTSTPNYPSSYHPYPQPYTPYPTPPANSQYAPYTPPPGNAHHEPCVNPYPTPTNNECRATQTLLSKLISVSQNVGMVRVADKLYDGTGKAYALDLEIHLNENITPYRFSGPKTAIYLESSQPKYAELTLPSSEDAEHILRLFNKTNIRVSDIWCKDGTKVKLGRLSGGRFTSTDFYNDTTTSNIFFVRHTYHPTTEEVSA